MSNCAYPLPSPKEPDTPRSFRSDDFLYVESSYKTDYEDASLTPNRRLFMCLAMCLAVFSTNLVSSMCAPFYPRSAASHGIDSDLTGSILGIYYATTVIASPFMAIAMSKIGHANLLQMGLFLVGTSSLVFGGIDYLDNSVAYAVVSFILRALQGLGCAATDTAVFAIASARFNKNLGKVNSYLNSCIGISFMLGPPLGGLIYAWSNFTLPFITSSALCFASCVLVNLAFRNLRESQLAKKDSVISPKVVLTKSLHLLSRIRFSWIAVTAMFGTACTSFLDPTLEPYLEASGYNNTAIVGVFYLVRDIAFTIGTPPIGTLLDSYKFNPNIVLVIGAIIAGVGYILLGVVGIFFKVFVTVRICIALVFIGVGQAPVFSATLSAMYGEAAVLGLKQDDDFCAIIAAVQNFAFYGGLWAGSVVSGAVTYYNGFPMSTALFGTSVIGVSLLHLLIHVCVPKRITYTSLEDLESEFQY